MTGEKPDRNPPQAEEAPTDPHLEIAEDAANAPSEAPAGDSATVEISAEPDAEQRIPSPEELKVLRKKAAEYDGLLDRLKRVTADYLNSQKRIQREMQERADHAIEAFALELLPVADNLARAIQAAREHATVERILEGVEMVETQLYDALARHGVTPVETERGHPFDPTVHEAVGVLPTDQQEPNRVVEEIQRGFRLHNRLIRPSRVVVSKELQEDQPAEDESKKEES